MTVWPRPAKSWLYRNDAADDEFRQVLECATNSILNAEAFRKPYPLIWFRDFFPSDFYARLLQRFDVDRFAGLEWGRNGGIRALRRAQRSRVGGEPRAWSIVRRVLASTEVASALREKLDEGFRIRSRRSGEAWPVQCIRGRSSTPTSTVMRDQASSRHPQEGPTMQIYLPSDDLQRELGTPSIRFPMGVFAWKSTA